jgi:hypothetical protein
MVYSNKFVLALLKDGTPQKELSNRTVQIPFGAEYSLRLRNKHSRRAVVQIYIDGENVSGGGYVIPANDHVDIKRHYDKDRAFKFVALDSEEAVDFGKNGPNPDKVKGTIEARFYLEKERPPAPIYKEVHHHHDHYYPKPYPVYPPVYPKPHWSDPWYGYGTYSSNSAGGSSSGMLRTCGIGDSASDSSNAGSEAIFGNSASYSAGLHQHLNSSRRARETKSIDSTPEISCSTAPATESFAFNAAPMPELKDGCTVEGGYTGQNFSSVYIDLEETYTTLKIFLQGFEDNHVDVVSDPTKIRKTNKSQKLDDLEEENQKLREKLAELENEQLKEKLAKKPKKTTKKSK